MAYDFEENMPRSIATMRMIEVISRPCITNGAFTMRLSHLHVSRLDCHLRGPCAYTVPFVVAKTMAKEIDSVKTVDYSSTYECMSIQQKKNQ